jgi:hypothetical protein
VQTLANVIKGIVADHDSNYAVVGTSICLPWRLLAMKLAGPSPATRSEGLEGRRAILKSHELSVMQPQHVHGTLGG